MGTEIMRGSVDANMIAFCILNAASPPVRNNKRMDNKLATVVMAAMPTGINSYIFAAIYGRAVGTAANSVLIGTVLSVLTITGWLAFLNAGVA